MRTRVDTAHAAKCCQGTTRTRVLSGEIKMDSQFGKQGGTVINIQDLYMTNSNIYKNSKKYMK